MSTVILCEVHSDVFVYEWTTAQVVKSRTPRLLERQLGCNIEDI